MPVKNGFQATAEILEIVREQNEAFEIDETISDKMKQTKMKNEVNVVGLSAFSDE